MAMAHHRTRGRVRRRARRNLRRYDGRHPAALSPRLITIVETSSWSVEPLGTSLSDNAGYIAPVLAVAPSGIAPGGATDSAM